MKLLCNEYSRDDHWMFLQLFFQRHVHFQRTYIYTHVPWLCTWKSPQTFQTCLSLFHKEVYNDLSVYWIFSKAITWSLLIHTSFVLCCTNFFFGGGGWGMFGEEGLFLNCFQINLKNCIGFFLMYKLLKPFPYAACWRFHRTRSLEQQVIHKIYV